MFNCAQLDQHRKGAVPSRSSHARYAIYYTPQPGTALAAFGRSWFGRANDGATLQAFSDAGLSGTSFAKLAVAPGRYTGLHALFRAPFAPRDGIGLDAIKTRLKLEQGLAAVEIVAPQSLANGAGVTSSDVPKPTTP